MLRDFSYLDGSVDSARSRQSPSLRKGAYIMLREVVVSSRIRLARNLKDVPFPMVGNEAIIKPILERTARLFTAEFKLNLTDTSGINEEEKLCFQLNNLSGAEFARGQGGLVLTNEENGISILLGEEDHFRLQCVLDGEKLAEAYALISQYDNYLCMHCNIAYLSKWGFLTACPTNVGTGLRASLMLYLPALTPRIKEHVNNLTKMGLTLRGAHGEGSKAENGCFQLSNQVTLGYTERQLIGLVTEGARILRLAELKERRILCAERGNSLAREAVECYKYLMASEEVTYGEAVTLLCTLRLAEALGVFKCRRIINYDKLLRAVQTYAPHEKHRQNEKEKIAKIIKTSLT